MRRRPALPLSHLEVEKEEEEEDAIRGQGEGRGLTAGGGGGGGGGASQWRSLVRRPRCRNSHSTLIFSSNLFPRPLPTSSSSSSEALAREDEANKMVVSTVPRFKKEASSLPSSPF